MAPDDTRTRLLSAARRLFAARGYEGATIRTITGEARTNLGAVTYHFGSKRNLYLEVIRDVVAPLRERVLATAAGDGGPRDRIERVLRDVFEHLWNNPDQAQFMVELRLRQGGIPPEVMELMTPIAAALAEIMEAGQEEGLVAPGPPLLFVLSLMAQPVYFMITLRRTPAELLPVDPSTAEGREAVLAHMVAFALGGLSHHRGVPVTRAGGGRAGRGGSGVRREGGVGVGRNRADRVGARRRDPLPGDGETSPQTPAPRGYSFVMTPWVEATSAAGGEEKRWRRCLRGPRRRPRPCWRPGA